MDRSLLEDPAAVASMAAGDPAGLESVYRRYADRIYAYARSIADDVDIAADVVQETFLIAQQRVGQLREPSRLASWLYAIARNECLARLRARRRIVGLAEGDEPVLDTDPGRALHAAHVTELVYAAAAGMNDGDREVLELTVRHGLASADLARVLGVSDKHAHARISRARAQFEGALGALVLARDVRGRCDLLDGIMHGWDGQLTALLRKRIERHARDCDACSARRRERMDPAGLLAGYAALPFLAVAAQLWPRLRLVSASRPLGYRSSDPAARTGRDRAVRRSAVVSAAAAVALLLGGVAVPVALDRLGRRDQAPEPSAAVSPAPSESIEVVDPEPTGTPTAVVPTRASSTPSTVAFGAQAYAQASCLSPATFRLQVTVQTTGGPPTTGVLYWREAPTSSGGLSAGVSTESAAMTVAGQLAWTTVHPTWRRVLWWTSIRAAGGRTVATPQTLAVNPCPPPAL